MTRSISHEIRTPLNTAFMALDLLIGNLHAPIPSLEAVDAYQADLQEIADSIKEGCDISLSILNQLLTFEKLSSGMMQLENKLVTVEQLLDSNMKLFKMQVRNLQHVHETTEYSFPNHHFIFLVIKTGTTIRDFISFRHWNTRHQEC